MQHTGEPRDLIALVEARALAAPDASLYSFLDRNGDEAQQLTYEQLFCAARRVAALLQDRGLQNQPVVLLYPHGADFIIAFFGAILAGAYPMPMSKPRGRDWQAIRAFIARSSARAILTVSGKHSQIPQEFLEQRELEILFTDTIEEDWHERWRRPDTKPDDIAFIQYTSGSTSQPKGVVVTHENVLHNSELIRVNLRNESHDIGVTWLPFFHDMGLIGHVVQPLYTRIHNYFMSPVAFIAQPLRWLQALSRYRGSISGGPNFAFELCCSRITDAEVEQLDLSTWRLMYCGAEKISPRTIQRFIAKLAAARMPGNSFYPCYGMAESTLFVCGRQGLRTHRPAASAIDYLSIGTRTESVDVLIVDPDTREVLNDGNVGEIWVRSNSVAREYYRDTAASSATFGQEAEQQAAYMRTGDLAFVLGEDVYFVGRLKNLMKLRGSSYYAEDIEEVVHRIARTHGLIRCAAFSIEHQEQEALIVLLELEIADPRAVVTLVHAEICQALGIVPYCVLPVAKNALPLTTSGKLQRNRCREAFLSGDYAPRVAAVRHEPSLDLQ